MGYMLETRGLTKRFGCVVLALFALVVAYGVTSGGLFVR